MKLLDQVSLLPGAHDAAFAHFANGQGTYREGLQIVARQYLAGGWLPRRLTVTPPRLALLVPRG